jgi:hypothetical protein
MISLVTAQVSHSLEQTSNLLEIQGSAKAFTGVAMILRNTDELALINESKKPINERIRLINNHVKLITKRRRMINERGNMSKKYVEFRRNLKGTQVQGY